MAVPFLVNLWQKIITTLTCWYNFDGVNEYLTIPKTDSINFERTDPFSFSIWLNTDRTNVFQPLFNNNTIVSFRKYEGF